MKAEGGKRLKWEPAAMMLLVLGMGLWLALGPASGPRFEFREGATAQDVRINQVRGALEFLPEGKPEFRLFMQGAERPREMTGDEVRGILGERVYRQAVEPRRNRVFRSLNITSWVGVVWLAIGLVGQLAFSGRMVLQWITSELRQQSVITESFWWFSVTGSVLLFSYFVWRQDPIGILGQASGVVVYARNLRLIYKQKRRVARAAAVAEGPDLGHT